MIIASIDKHPVLRKGLSIFLECQFPDATILEAENYESYLTRHGENLPELFIWGLEEESEPLNENSIKELKKRLPNTALIVYDGECRYNMAVACMVAGASGYLLKTDELEELENCINTVLQGRRYVNEEMLSILLSQSQELINREISLSTLSRGEYQVAKFLSQGMQTSEIANLQQFKVATINKQRSNIFKKLNVTNTIELQNILFS